MRTKIPPITNLSAAVPIDFKMHVSNQTTKDNGKGAASRRGAGADATAYDFAKGAKGPAGMTKEQVSPRT